VCPSGAENNQPKKFLGDTYKRMPMKRLGQADAYQGTLLWMLGDALSYLIVQLF